jgi:hypothetical protein
MPRYVCSDCDVSVDRPDGSRKVVCPDCGRRLARAELTVEPWLDTVAGWYWVYMKFCLIGIGVTLAVGVVAMVLMVLVMAGADAAGKRGGPGVSPTLTKTLP